MPYISSAAAKISPTENPNAAMSPQLISYILMRGFKVGNEE
jgi:hypothetical protein